MVLNPEDIKTLSIEELKETLTESENYVRYLESREDELLGRIYLLELTPFRRFTTWVKYTLWEYGLIKL